VFVEFRQVPRLGCEVGNCIIDGEVGGAACQHRVVGDVADGGGGCRGTRRLSGAKWLSACVVTQYNDVSSSCRTPTAVWYSFAQHASSPSLRCIIGCYLFIACKSTDFGTRARHFHIKPGTRWCFIHKYWRGAPVPCMLMLRGTHHYANKASRRPTCKAVIHLRHECILLCWLLQLAFCALCKQQLKVTLLPASFSTANCILQIWSFLAFDILFNPETVKEWGKITQGHIFGPILQPVDMSWNGPTTFPECKWFSRWYQVRRHGCCKNPIWQPIRNQSCSCNCSWDCINCSYQCLHGFFTVQSYTKTAVVNWFVQF